MSIFGKFRLHRQARDCLESLDLFTADFGDQFVWDSIKKDAEKAIRTNAAGIKRRVLHDGIQPRDIVLTLLANLALQAISSGKYHIYRGTLTMAGNSFQSMFTKILNLQVQGGAITNQERNQALVNLRDAIRDAG